MPGVSDEGVYVIFKRFRAPLLEILEYVCSHIIITNRQPYGTPCLCIYVIPKQS